ncbi:MAG: flippase-like domain-containing protein [Bacteriovoracaceae bacterium]|jgi:glycosyltransferase 2 family protein|nr:flippase-like domain-containing protein [Bacteriovoracaceae bacterium]
MLKTILKLVFAGGIIVWLLRSGKLDFNLVSQSLELGYYWLAALFIIICNACLSASRWKVLLEIKTGVKLSYVRFVKMTWIGLFFNSFLPGAVTGDFIKLLYAKDLDNRLTKTYLVTSVLMDRILGLIGLLFLVGSFSLSYYSEIITKSPQISKLMNINLLLFLGAIIFLITLFLPQKTQDLFLNLSLKVPFIGSKIEMTLKQVWLIGKNKLAVLKCLGISLTCQFLNVICFYLLIYQFIGNAVPLGHAFTFIPLGFVVVAIPISPAGLGVGHVAFQTLFSYFSVEGGASYFNLYFLLMIFNNLFGVIPYLLSSKKHSLTEASQFGQS